MTSPGQLAQRLHDKWCEQMREKGFHGPDKECSLCPVRQTQRDCEMFHADLILWADLDESRRQEYLETAKAVLPEIVGEIFDDAINVIETTKVMHGDHYAAYRAISNDMQELSAALMNRRDRRLEELK